MAATALSNSNIRKVEEYTETIRENIGKWNGYQDSFNSALNSDVGKIFAENFTIGADQTTKISALLKILVGMQDNTNKLIEDTYEFCEMQRRANMEEDN